MIPLNIVVDSFCHNQKKCGTERVNKAYAMLKRCCAIWCWSFGIHGDVSVYFGETSTEKLSISVRWEITAYWDCRQISAL